MMRLVYLANSPIPSRMASSIHIMKMCQAFAKNGHEVTLIVPNNQSDFEPGLEDVFRFYDVEKVFSIARTAWLDWLPRGKGYINVPFAVRLAHKIKPDLVYARDGLACTVAASIGMPVIYEVHQPSTNASGLAQIFYRHLFTRNSLKRVVAITKALAEWYKARYPHLSEKLLVAPDGADPVVTTVSNTGQMNDEHPMRVGYVGHLYLGRGIELIERIAKRSQTWSEYHIIGGTSVDIEACKARTALLNNFHVHGFMPYAEASDLRSGFDVLLAPYQRVVHIAGDKKADTSGFMSPLKIFEYMAAGKAIIASDLPVLREVLRDGENCLLCPSDDETAWVNALIKLRDNPDLRQKIGRQAQTEFLEHYTWTARAEKVLADL